LCSGFDIRQKSCLYYSVADPGCLTRILIFTHSGSRIPDLGSKNSNKREGWKKFVVKPFFVAKNFTKLKIILFFKWWRKKFGPVFKELYNFLPKNLSLSSKIYGVGIRDPEKTLSRILVQGQKGAGSRITEPGSRIPDPGSGSVTLLYYSKYQ
jgi:hypothetical protein